MTEPISIVTWSSSSCVLVHWHSCLRLNELIYSSISLCGWIWRYPPRWSDYVIIKTTYYFCPQVRSIISIYFYVICHVSWLWMVFNLCCSGTNSTNQMYRGFHDIGAPSDFYYNFYCSCVRVCLHFYYLKSSRNHLSLRWCTGNTLCICTIRKWPKF